jgi:FkbM family methyltransferase
MIKVFKTLADHPLSAHQKIRVYTRYILWQFTSRLGRPIQVKRWVGNLQLIVKRGYHASTSCHYLGLPEFESMAFVAHFLRPGDMFYDIGANIGAYSLLASGIAGADSMAFEPEPKTATLLRKNIALNKLETKIEVQQMGIGAANKPAFLTTNKGIQNHIASSKYGHGVDISMATLDDFEKIKSPILIKLDVEGFETAVVNGATLTLQTPQIQSLIIERMGLGQRFGFNEDDLHEKLSSFGFKLYKYQPETRKLHPIGTPFFGNNLYLKDADWVSERLINAPAIRVNGRLI